MWNLTGDDIQRAKEELKGRRAAIKAHYDSEMKQLETDIAAIETFERAAVNFVSNFKGQDESPVTAEPAAERRDLLLQPLGLVALAAQCLDLPGQLALLTEPAAHLARLPDAGVGRPDVEEGGRGRPAAHRPAHPAVELAHASARSRGRYFSSPASR